MTPTGSDAPQNNFDHVLDDGLDDLSYEAALELFDGKLRSLEEGNLTLEEAITAVEEGRRYLKVCEARLNAARQKIEVRPQAPAVPAVPEPAVAEEPPLEDRLL